MNSLIKYFVNTYGKITFWIIDKKILAYALRSPLRIVLGAGGVSHRTWLSTEIEHLNVLVLENWQRYFRENSIDAMLAEHVWEHFSEAEGIVAARNCHFYLKPGGYLRVAVPDGFHPSIEYRDDVKPMGSGPGSDDHKVLFTYISITRLFEDAGFKVELLEYFDENGVFHGKEWDSEDGFVKRSMRCDDRNREGRLGYTSIILDAWKMHDHV